MLIWPSGFTIRQGAAEREVIGPRGVVIRDGTLLQDAAACVGDDATLFISDVGQVLAP
jgi:hypothetical protein